MNKQRVALSIAVLAAIFSVGLILYPLAGTLYNQHHQSTVHSQYLETVEEMEDEAIQTLRKHAREYNDLIRGGAREAGAFDLAALRKAQRGYQDQLNLLGDGVMGYIEIPKIGVQLPIFHGTEDKTLLLGAGHLLGSSLPVGGEGCHTVLTAHSGMAANRMFSDLPEMEAGDIFFLNILGSRLGYRVEQIRITLPGEVDELRVEKGRDLCTLVTCTPFGINTHRLLVRGERIPEAEMEAAGREAEAERTESGEHPSVWGSEYMKGLGIGLLIVILIALTGGLLRWIRNNRTKEI